MGLNVASGEAIDLSKISRGEFNKMYREAFVGLDEKKIKAQIENISNEEEKALY
jgi:hypothetical protein